MEYYFSFIFPSPTIIGAPACCKPYLGSLDEFKMFNRTLSLQEITSIYDTEKSGLLWKPSVYVYNIIYSCFPLLF